MTGEVDRLDALPRSTGPTRGLDGAVARGAPGQGQQVGVLGVVQTQRPGHRVEHRPRRPFGPALLQPRVPGDRHSGEQGDLLATQPGGAATGSAREPDVGRVDRCPAGAQEVAELTLPLAIPLAVLTAVPPAVLTTVPTAVLTAVLTAVPPIPRFAVGIGVGTGGHLPSGADRDGPRQVVPTPASAHTPTRTDRRGPIDR